MKTWYCYEALSFFVSPQHKLPQSLLMLIWSRSESTYLSQLIYHTMNIRRARACYLLLDWWTYPDFLQKAWFYLLPVSTTTTSVGSRRLRKAKSRLMLSITHFNFKINHRITKWLKLEGTSGSHLVQNYWSNRAA